MIDELNQRKSDEQMSLEKELIEKKAEAEKAESLAIEQMEDLKRQIQEYNQ